MKKILSVFVILFFGGVLQGTFVSADDEFKMCANGSLSISVSCKEDDEITMKCSN